MARILVIDDHAETRAFLADLLAHAGHEVGEAPDGDAGISSFLADPVDLVITDVEMPRRSGLDVIQRLCYEFPKTKIIALTGSSGPEALLVRANAQVFGAHCALEKPVRARVLLDTVEDALKSL